MAKITPDLSDKTRCASVHWQLPVQCQLPSSHAENWHETTHPETGERLRYRYPGRLTQVYRHEAWRPITAPTEPFEPITPDAERALRLMVGDGTGGFSNRAVGTVLAELDRVRKIARFLYGDLRDTTSTPEDIDTDIRLLISLEAGAPVPAWLTAADAESEA